MNREEVILRKNGYLPLDEIQERRKLGLRPTPLAFSVRIAEGPEKLRAASTRDDLLRAFEFEKGILTGYFLAGMAQADEYAEAATYLKEVARWCEAEFAQIEAQAVQATAG